MAASNGFIQANTNGRLHSAHESVISPLDRGFLYGDAIYEVWRTYHGAVFCFREHWERLEASASALHLALPFDAAAAWRELVRTTQAFRQQTGELGDLYIRLQISRGAGQIGLDPALADEPLWTFLVQKLPGVDETKAKYGLNVKIARQLCRNHPHTLHPRWKTGNYLNNLLAHREAKAAGADEVLMLNLDGAITEAATMNVAFVRDGEVFTPALESGILAGVTRKMLIENVAPRIAARVHELVLRESDLGSFTEAFFLSTTKDLTPISHIDGQCFRVGSETLTARLKREFGVFAGEQADLRGEYRLA